MNGLSRYAASVDRPSHFEPGLVQPSFQREIYAYAHFSDRDKFCCAAFHVRFNGEWDHSFQRGFRFPADFRRYRSGKAVTVLSAFWGFVLMALHLGQHWNMILGMVRKAAGPVSSKPLRILLHIAAASVAGYGLYAFLKNQFLSYMFLTSSFVFFDFERPVLLFFTEYIAIMGLFIFLAQYTSRGIQRLAGSRKRLVEKKK